MALMVSGIIGCYCIYVDDTLVLVKENQIHKILKVFNLFYKHLWFTVHKFENEDVHFLDKKIMNNDKFNIHIKYTNSDL